MTDRRHGDAELRSRSGRRGASERTGRPAAGARPSPTSTSTPASAATRSCPRRSSSSTAIERGLTHVAVTNHNNVEGAVAVRDKVAELGLTDQLTVILGEEVSTADGEVVGALPAADHPARPQRDETADAIHEQGGLV